MKIHEVNVEPPADGDEVNIVHFGSLVYKEVENLQMQFCMCNWNRHVFFGFQQLTMKHLLSWTRTNLIKERPEMFMKGDTV